MNPTDEMTKEKMLSMLFAEMVIQQTNMAMLFMGKVPHPQTGKTSSDLNAARIFIDQLEMLEVKTKGNLTKDEEALLKESLSHLRLTYVDVANEQGAQPARKTDEAPPAQAPVPAPAPTEETEESRKRFTKKY